MSRLSYQNDLRNQDGGGRKRPRYSYADGEYDRSGDNEDRFEPIGGDFRRRKLPQQFSGAPSNGGNPKEALFMVDALKKQSGGVTGVIHSTGRHDPTSKQSIINTTYMFSKTLYDTRSQTLPEDQLAPLGTRKDQHLAAGMWLFSETRNGGGRVNVRRGIGGFGEVEVADNVNGVSRNAALRFCGLGVTETDPTDVNARTDCTGTIAGTCTGINTGPFTMRPGMIFGFLWTPYTVTDHGVSRAGIQIEGISKNKYVPMMIPMDELATPAIYKRAIVAAYASDWVKRTGPNADKFEESWREARFKMRTVILNTPLEDDGVTSYDDIMPVDLYLAWLMLGEFYTADAANLVEKQQMRMATVSYHSELLVPDTITWTGNYSDQTRKDVELRKAQCLANQQSWVASHAAGKILTAAPPGSQVDVMLGYFSY
jgi:hypothetical protein